MNTNCTVYKTANFIGKKWTLDIILEIYKGKGSRKRYSEIKKAIPDITPKILSSRLKELEKEGIIKKVIDASSFPIKCEYNLTPAGNDFIKIINQFKKWSLKWKYNNKLCEDTNCKECEF